MINPYSIGKKIYLRSPSEEDLNGSWYEWFSDPEVTQYLADRYWPNSRQLQREFYEMALSSKDRLVLSVCDKETDEHIGVCNLSNISWLHRNADIALVIGKKEFRTGIYSVEVLSLLLDIAFNRLNLLNLRSSHLAINAHTAVIEKLFSFKQVARFEKYYFYKGEYVDGIYSQLKREDWARRNSSKSI